MVQGNACVGAQSQIWGFLTMLPRTTSTKVTLFRKGLLSFRTLGIRLYVSGVSSLLWLRLTGPYYMIPQLILTLLHLNHRDLKILKLLDVTTLFPTLHSGTEDGMTVFLPGTCPLILTLWTECVPVVGLLGILYGSLSLLFSKSTTSLQLRQTFSYVTLIQAILIAELVHINVLSKPKVAYTSGTLRYYILSNGRTLYSDFLILSFSPWLIPIVYSRPEPFECRITPRSDSASALISDTAPN